ncbi:putative Alcohol oxidase [Seiridium unicorne]|uniref:Alcohol oxidase n=1 Tax=Seiridium unicorne TaxID=138068 RepID=A0ABR2V9I1_9PEZI
MISPFIGFPGDPTGIPTGQYFANTVFSVYPYSRGHVHINTTNLNNPIDFQTGFFYRPYRYYEALHSMGTNKIAPRENGGIVDPNLGVYGLEALKVADLSIAPANITANTADTAFAIGEKAADIFIKELGLAK